MRWCRVVVVVGACAGSAYAGTDTSQLPPADTLPPPTSAPVSAEPAAPVPAQPPPAVVQSSTTTRLVDRHGPAFLAGIELVDDDRVLRVDAMMPIPVASAPHLRAGLELGYAHNSGSIPELSVDAYAFEILPTVTYDWKLPIRSRAGDFVITAEGSLGVAIARVKFDEPFMPGTFENLTGYVLQLASALQFRGTSGLVVSIQCIGFQIPLNTPQPKNSNQMLTSDVGYAFAVMVGYQL